MTGILVGVGNGTKYLCSTSSKENFNKRTQICKYLLTDDLGFMRIKLYMCKIKKNLKFPALDSFGADGTLLSQS